MPSPVNNLTHFFRFYLSSLRASLVREMEFRLNFFLGLLRMALWAGVFIFQLEIIFHNAPSLAGWSKPDVLIIVALSRVIEGMMNAVFSFNIGSLPDEVVTGKFDFHLIKPLPAQLYMAFRRFRLYDLGNVIIGLVLLVYAFSLKGALPAFGAWLSFLVLVVSSLVIFYSLLIMISSLVFFIDRLTHVWGFYSIMTEPLTVPFSIFPPAARLALTFFLPIAFLVFVPAQALTGRLAAWHIPTALTLAAIFLTLANLIWRAGLRRYSSASS